MIASQSWNLVERVEVITDLTLSQSGQAVRIFYIECLREYVQSNNDSHIARSSSTFSGPLQYGLCCTGGGSGDFRNLDSNSLHFTLARKQPSRVDESPSRSNLLSKLPSLLFTQAADTFTLKLSVLILS